MNKKSVAQSLMAAVVCVMAASAGAETVMTTDTFANTNEDFAKFSARIAEMNGRNLLPRTETKITSKDISGAQASQLCDGLAGVRAGEGRVMIGGAPTVINVYLGAAKAIKEVGAFTFNGDTRANQDFEVRFADNSDTPGVTPAFGEKPDLTTGDKVLGKNGGGVHTYFREKSGGDLTAKADWVQFRTWATLGVREGEAAHSGKAGAASAYIELEVLGPENDVVIVTKEQKEFKAKKVAAVSGNSKPVWEKKATWLETYMAARKAIIDWEVMQDELALPDSGVSLGAWHVLGPFAADSKEAKALDGLRKVDLAAPVKLKDHELTWLKRDDIKDGTLVDLSSLKAKPGEVVFLYREAKVAQAFDKKNPFGLGVGMSGGMVHFLPSGPTFQIPVGSPMAPNFKNQDLNLTPGVNGLMVRVVASPDGRCAMWFQAQPSGMRPGAGTLSSRISRRENLLEELKPMFPDATDQAQIGWEQMDSIWTRFDRGAMSHYTKYHTDWAGDDAYFLPEQFKEAMGRRLVQMQQDAAVEPAAVQARVKEWIEKFKPTVAALTETAGLRAKYYAVCTMQETMAESHRMDSMRMAVEDQRDTFKERYTKAAENLARIDGLAKRMDALWTAAMAEQPAALAGVMALRKDEEAASSEILLSNPVLDFDKVLLVSGGPGFSSNWGGPNRLGSELVVLSPVRPDGKLTTIYKGGISDMDLNWDGKRLLMSDGKQLRELNIEQALAMAQEANVPAKDPTTTKPSKAVAKAAAPAGVATPASPAVRLITDPAAPVGNYDGCYMPSGDIMFVSSACEQAVPCTGGAGVGNIHLVNSEGKNERRLTYDQDHDWNPVVLHNGRVLYTRWEYEDTPHYFTRLLFHMNPDGTGQSEYYGSGSYWPNAMYWPRPIPGHPTQVSCIVSGHHGVGRMGEMVILDPGVSRFEAEGAVQRIPGRGKKVEPVIKDGLVSEVWPRFASPYPLGDETTGQGGGKYFLVNIKMTPTSPWGLYLVDIYDNMTPIVMGGYSTPIPLKARPVPPIIPPAVNLERKDATVYMVDVYQGGGLKGFPRGSIKALRIGSYEYRYPGNGDTYASSMDGGWDVKKILGTVPVCEDGSAYFRVPANTPIFVQPLDADGKAQQIMRSWFVTMPGEMLSCVGCHEKQSSSPPATGGTMALARGVVDITEWHGPVLRGFSYDRDVQPVLDRHCVGCHNPAAKPMANGKPMPDLTAKSLHKDYTGKYSPSYLALHPYVRRAGYEADYHLAVPAEFEADTSPLIQHLKMGHKNVELNAEEWDRLYTWIDFNIPYPPNWRESHKPSTDEMIARRAKYQKQYAFIDDHTEDVVPPPTVGAFEAPKPETPRAEDNLKLDNWPMTAEAAQKLQKETNLAPLTLDLGEGVALTLAPIPAGKFIMGDAKGLPNEGPRAIVAIDKPFYMTTLEVTNAQYARFDPAHDSGYMDGRGKDRINRGYPVNEPNQPVIRVSWQQAMAYCAWLSKKTGKVCTLPTESQWEWACRAGTDTSFSFGEKTPGVNDLANFADNTISGWGWGRVEPNYADRGKFSDVGGKYKPNAWGLFDMHGNVAEWCLTTYRAYPYAADGRDDGDPAGLKVVRGGSWNDLFIHGKSSSRWRYQSYQPVYNVGFRVVVQDK